MQLVSFNFNGGGRHVSQKEVHSCLRGRLSMQWYCCRQARWSESKHCNCLNASTSNTCFAWKKCPLLTANGHFWQPRWGGVNVACEIGTLSLDVQTTLRRGRIIPMVLSRGRCCLACGLIIGTWVLSYSHASGVWGVLALPLPSAVFTWSGKICCN